MIDRKGTTVYNKGKKIKTFEEEEDAESFANALSMMENNKTSKVVEQKINKLFTSINEFKQHLNISEGNENKLNTLIEEHKDMIFSVYTKYLNEMFKKNNFENILLEHYEISRYSNSAIKLLFAQIYNDYVTDDVMFDIDKYPFLKDAEPVLEFHNLLINSEFTPGWATGPSRNGHPDSWHDGDWENPNLEEISINDDEVEIVIYLYDYEYEITKNVKLGDYFDIEALNNFVYDKINEEISDYLDKNFEPDFYNPYD